MSSTSTLEPAGEPIPLPMNFPGSGPNLPPDQWQELLSLAEQKSWTEAVRHVLGEAELNTQLYHLGPELLYGLPWYKLPTALEIGAELGTTTIHLAQLARQVTAVDTLPWQARFLETRLQQMNLPNVQMVIANPLALPFPAESIDVIVLGGQFAYLGYYGEGDPAQLQQAFLAQAFRLLRPEGYLYIGTETRFGLAYLLGKRNPSGRRFTSLLPRSWTKNSRMALHTPGQYQKMLQQAGFPTVEVHGVFTGYRQQKAAYPLANPQARAAILDMVDPPASFGGMVRRSLLNRFPWRQTLENEVALIACKKASSDRLLWSNLSTPGPLAQFSTTTKISLLDFADGQPSRISRMVKKGHDPDRLIREYAFLEKAGELLGSEAGTLKLRWPRPLGKEIDQAPAFYHFEYLTGPTLAQLLLPWSYRPEQFRSLLTNLVEGYVDLTQRLASRWPNQAAAEEFHLDALENIVIDNKTLSDRVREACRSVRTKPWTRQVMHGDLTLNNTVLNADGQLVLVDWENYSVSGLAGIDLMRLLYDAWLEKEFFAPWLDQQFLPHVREAVRQGLQRLQLFPEDYANLEVLFIAHQVQFDRSRDCDVNQLIQAYEQRVLDLN
jgi:SAM-dependent methyltransferase